MWRAILTGGGVFAADRITKCMARRDRLPREAINGQLRFRHVENDGLAGGIARGRRRLSKILPCLCFAIAAPALLLGFGKKSSGEQLGIAMLLAGSAGNVYDRIRRGTVTDMLQFPKAPGRLKRLVFNLADFAILIGGTVTAVTMLWHLIEKEG